MANAIYSLKIWMFRQQFKLTKRNRRELLMFVYSLFICMSKHGSRPHLQYLILTLTFSLSRTLTVTRTSILQSLALPRRSSEDISLWYLSEELAVLAFFDDKVPNGAKQKIVLSLQKPAAEHPLKRANVDPPAVRAKHLEDFVTPSTGRFFNITGFSASFLDKDLRHGPKMKTTSPLETRFGV